MRKRNYCTRGESLFKEDTPVRALRRRRKSRSPCTEAAQPMTRGAGPTSHTDGGRASECRTATRSEPSPAVVCPFISAKNNGPIADTGGLGPRVILLGSRFLGAEKANRRARPKSEPPPAVVCLFISVARNKPPSLWHGGPGPRVILLGAAAPGCGEGEPPLTPALRLLGAVAEDIEGNFSNQCSGIKAPHA
jgi:hypothetical protein